MVGLQSGHTKEFRMLLQDILLKNKIVPCHYYTAKLVDYYKVRASTGEDINNNVMGNCRTTHSVFPLKQLYYITNYFYFL